MKAKQKTSKAKVSLSKKSRPKPAVDWKKRYAVLQKERTRLRREMVEVRKERDDYLQGVFALMRDEKVSDRAKEAALAELSRDPANKRVVAELEAARTKAS